MSAFSVQKFKTEASMATIRGSRFVTVLAVALGGFTVLASGTSFAQEKHKISYSTKAENTKYTFQHGLEIPDIPGHILRMIEIRVTWPDGGAPTIQGEKVVEAISRGMSDLIAGNGLAHGYTMWRFENGDQAFQQYEDSVQSVVNPDQSKKVTFVGTYVMTEGTGKLKGLKGVGRFSGFADFNAEGKATRTAYSAEGEYWFDNR